MITLLKLTEQVSTANVVKERRRTFPTTESLFKAPKVLKLLVCNDVQPELSFIDAFKLH
jgi:hypothetical protein